jgi:uncharacterized protein YbjT (DUF2867 family)
MIHNKAIVLVTGATGKQGGAVARELLSHGYRVRAMTRKPAGDAAKALKILGADVVQADLDDVRSLDSALKGVWGVFSVQNTWEAGVDHEEEQGKRLAERAFKAKVEHFVYTSVGSAHRRTGIPHFDNKYRIEDAVRRIGFRSYTIIRPVFFMENWVSPWFKPGLEAGKLMVGLKPETALQMIAVEDIGKYGLLAFEKQEELNKREIDIAGDKRTMSETAEILGKALGKRIAFTPVPIEEVRKASEDYAIMLEWFDRVGYDVDILKLSREFGIRPTTLSEWAERTLSLKAAA